MQGSIPQGGDGKRYKSPPRTKSFGTVPIGGRSKWTGTDTSAKLPSTSELQPPASGGPRGMTRGRTAKEKEEAEKESNIPNHTRDHPGSYAAFLAGLYASIPSFSSSSFFLSFFYRVGFIGLFLLVPYVSKQVPSRKLIEDTPELQSIWGLPAVSRGKDAARTVFRHPSHCPASPSRQKPTHNGLSMCALSFVARQTPKTQ